MSYHDRARAFARGALLLSATLAAAASAGPMQADVTIDANANTVTKTRIVNVSDLDLASAHGRRIADLRLKLAVNDVCEVWDISPAREQREFVACSKTALRAARAQVSQRMASRDTTGITVSSS